MPSSTLSSAMKSKLPRSPNIGELLFWAIYGSTYMSVALFEAPPPMVGFLMYACPLKPAKTDPQT